MQLRGLRRCDHAYCAPNRLTLGPVEDHVSIGEATSIARVIDPVDCRGDDTEVESCTSESPRKGPSALKTKRSRHALCR